MGLPIIAIVGRPNVGKSSLLNALAGRRIAIVDPTPGVTRDRLSVPIALPGRDDDADTPRGYAELIDTGGMGIEDVDRLTDHVEAQIGFALAKATVILFVVDAREGILPLDREVAQRLRRTDTPVILVANKIDQAHLATESGEFFRLGFGEPVRISAAHVTGLADLMDLVVERLGERSTEPAPAPVMQFAIVGKRNAGKSTFINALAGESRVIVSEVPGTTRDSVDVQIDIGGRIFTVIDTAGVRKRKSFSGDIEYYSHHRAMRSIRRADVVALMIDASVPISQVDKDLAGEIAAEFKPVVLVVNKWDLARGVAAGEDYQEYFDKVFPELSFAPITLTTATQGTNVRETIRVAEELYRQSRTRLGTGELNTMVEEILTERGPSHKAGTKPPRLYYASQVSVAPPTIACFVNDLGSFDQRYQRFLLNRLRDRVPFAEIPIRLLFRPRGNRKPARPQEGSRG